MKALGGKAGEARVVEQLQPCLLIPGDFDDVRERLLLYRRMWVADQLELIEKINGIQTYCASIWQPRVGDSGYARTLRLCELFSQLDHSLYDRLRR